MYSVMMKGLSAFTTLIPLSILNVAQPNVVILYADDMGVADVSYGDEEAKIQTPHIDRLAEKSTPIRFG